MLTDRLEGVDALYDHELRVSIELVLPIIPWPSTYHYRNFILHLWMGLCHNCACCFLPFVPLKDHSLRASDRVTC